MVRTLACIGATAAVLAGCGGGGGTNLTIEVSNAFGHVKYLLKCDPPGGIAPRPAVVCATLADNSHVMLLNRHIHSSCVGGLGTAHLYVHGLYRGHRVEATEVDGCQGNPEGGRLWLEALGDLPALAP